MLVSIYFYLIQKIIKYFITHNKIKTKNIIIKEVIKS